MSDWTDLIDLAGDIVEEFVKDEDIQKAIGKGRALLRKAGKQVPPGQPPAAAIQPETMDMTPEDMTPENMTPELLQPQNMRPQNEIPEGESAQMPPPRPQKPEQSEPLRYLTHICNRGIQGAMITNEILEPPLALRSGYLARYRRKLR